MNQAQFALAHFNRAANYYQQACYVQAIQHYLAGLKVDSTRAEIYADLAKAYEMVGCWDWALACLDFALRLNPNYSTAQRRKARIFEEKGIYESLIAKINLDLEPSRSFLREHQVRSRTNLPPVIEREFFVLKYEDTIPSKVLWVICQLIERTYHQVGDIFQCYPPHKVSISIEDISRLSTSQSRSLPHWAAASYDGSIRLTYCAYGEPAFGILLALIRHEWVHLLVDRLTKRQCDTWLDEGLAQVVARPMMSFERQQLRIASQKKQLLTPRELKKPFSQMASNRRRLAYLQSTAIVAYLIQQFGVSQIRKLLRRIANGKPTDVAIQTTYGRTVDEIVLASTVEGV